MCETARQSAKSQRLVPQIPVSRHPEAWRKSRPASETMTAHHPGDSIQGWVLDRIVGSGSFATVWKARKGSGEGQSCAAVKVIATDKLSPKLKQSLECEVSILKRISHTNVVKLHEVAKARGCMYLVMEFCGGGDMAEYIRRHRRIPETTARSFIQQLAAGLKAMWQNNFVHRDLKPQNLLLSDSSSQAVLKIADFGFARDLQPQRMADTLCGSPLYMAPEILQFQKYDAKADLWSVGIILYELLIGQTPFDGANHIQLLRNIEGHDVHIPLSDRSKVSPHSTNLIYQLLKRNPIERISFEEFFSHPFVQPGSLPTSFSEDAPDFSPLAPTRSLAMHTIASSLALGSTSGEEELPFSMEAREQPSRSGRKGRAMQRVDSEPPTPVCRQVLVRQPGQHDAPQPLFQGLQGNRKAARDMAQTSLTNSLEDEDDYVIIERTPSSGGLRGYSQSAPTSSYLKAQPKLKVIHVPPPPPPLTVPLIVQPQQSQSAASMSQSVGVLKFSSGLSQGEALRRVGWLLEDIASRRESQGKYSEALALRLLTLQVLQHALSKRIESSKVELAKASVGNHEITKRLHGIAEGAQQVAALLQLEERAGGLPDVWEVVYKAALAFAKAAAVDEMLGNLSASLQSYAKAGTLLYFISTDAGKLALQPPLQLESTDLYRLQRYMACIALRHQGCSDTVKGSDIGKSATS